MLKMRKLGEPKNIAEDNSFEDTTAKMVDWETRTQTPVVDVTGHSDMGIPIPISLAFWASPVNVKFCAMGDGHRYRSRPLCM